MFNAYARIQATDDLLGRLDKALNQHVIPLDSFLKEVDVYSRIQFEQKETAERLSQETNGIIFNHVPLKYDPPELKQ